MKPILRTLMALALSSLAYAQQAVRMEGHALGETVAQYRDVERLTVACQTSLHDEKVVNQIRKWREAETRKPRQTKIRQPILPYPYDECQHLQHAETGATTLYSTPMFEITFVSGHLVRYKHEFNDNTESYAQIVADLTARYGRPYLDTTETHQNAYGAQFPVGRTAWTLEDKTTISAVETVEYTSSLGYWRHTRVAMALAAAPSETIEHTNPF